MDNTIQKEIECTGNIINWAKEQDTTALARFFSHNSEKDLICVGSGGSFSVCRYIALMYSTGRGLGTAITPYSFYTLSDDVVRRSKLLLVSTSGHNKDIVTVAKKCMKINPEWTANLTSRDGTKNDLKRIINPCNSFNFESDISDGFISVNSVTANYILALKAFKGLEKFNISTLSFQYSPRKDIRHFIILYGGWGEPAALDLESKLVESGLATAAVSDFRNFCHGRFILASNHCGHEKKDFVPNDCAVILLSTPREEKISEAITSIIPERCKVFKITSAESGAEASIELMLKATALFGEYALANDTNPLSPPNYGRIDKLKPQQIPFIKEIKDFGPFKI